ncbi:MAG: twin-arginine translocation signal domain-containing protein [Candidatus Rokuibacteriota bacterium]
MTQTRRDFLKRTAAASAGALTGTAGFPMVSRPQARKVVVWWNRGDYIQEDLLKKIIAAITARRVPDVAFCFYNDREVVPNYAFFFAWNEYLYAVLFLQGEQLFTRSISMGTFLTGDDAPWNHLMALSTISAIPPVIVCYVVRRYLTDGLVGRGAGDPTGCQIGDIGRARGPRTLRRNTWNVLCSTPLGGRHGGGASCVKGFDTPRDGG